MDYESRRVEAQLQFEWGLITRQRYWEIIAEINREEFIKQNLGLVHSICRRFAGRGIEDDDLYQAGCMGLVKAVDAYDLERGFANK